MGSLRTWSCVHPQNLLAQCLIWTVWNSGSSIGDLDKSVRGSCFPGNRSFYLYFVFTWVGLEELIEVIIRDWRKFSISEVE